LPTFRPKATEVAITHVIAENDDDIGPLGCLRETEKKQTNWNEANHLESSAHL
jgi:hypothetical protein